MVVVVTWGALERDKGPNFSGWGPVLHGWLISDRHLLSTFSSVLFTLRARVEWVPESPIVWNKQNGIGASSRGTAWDRLNLGSNESQYKILNPHMPQDRGFSRILVRDGDKHERKSRFFEYLATPNNQYFNLTKNLFFSFLTSSESELTTVIPMMS